ncbi:hypothetical protein [Streptomyces fragilis]|uniref:Uncharacterized protein n=1 Tax=Streptomyces fragilis TaxID=67301 RepID=A0ABV2YAS5_9ACTN|nr:hypothetical protein [Streptomyces fragilis]
MIVVVQQPAGRDPAATRDGGGPAVPGTAPATPLPGGTHPAVPGGERALEDQDSPGAADDPGAPSASPPEGS